MMTGVEGEVGSDFEKSLAEGGTRVPLMLLGARAMRGTTAARWPCRAFPSRPPGRGAVPLSSGEVNRFSPLAPAPELFHGHHKFTRDSVAVRPHTLRGFGA